jgi:hypothetical protein
MLELDDVAGVVAGAVREATVPLIERIDALEKRELLLPEKGDKGADCDMEEVARRIDAKVSEIVSAAFAALPVPQDGKSVDMSEVRELVASAIAEVPPPKDGLDCDMAAVEAVLDKKVGDAVSALPSPENGRDAEIDMEAVAELIDKAVSARPLPQDGKDCDMDVVTHQLGELVEAAIDKLPRAKDGVGLANALKDQAGHLILVMTDGGTKDLGKIDGEPGRDGLGFDDLNVEQIGERTIRFLLKRGVDEAEFDVTLPVPIYRGVFKEAEVYEPADLTTWAGSLWHLNEAKGLKPGAPDSGWQLAAKAGRPGKDAGKSLT